MYEFDWDGDSLVVGDGESQNTDEPDGDQEGIDAPGAQAAFTDFSNFGIYNGNFRQGPPNNGTGISQASIASEASSNFLPGWRYVRASNSLNHFAAQTRDASSPSGSNFRITFLSGAAADEAYIEQIVDIGGSRAGGFPDTVRATVIGLSGNTGTFTGRLALQYLTTDGAITGMPAEQVHTATVAAGATEKLEAVATTGGISPPAARFLRVRLGALRGGAATTATGSLDFSEVRREARVSKQEFTTAGAHTWYKPAGATWVRVVLLGGGGGGGSGRRGAGSTARSGGAGGAGSGMMEATFLASDLTDTITVTIGAGGAGGAAVATTDTNGNNGSVGGATTFGSRLRAPGADFGLGGTVAGGDSGGVFGVGMFQGGPGAASQASGGAGQTQSYADSTGGAGGGGSGGGLTSANASSSGGNGTVPIQVRNLVSGGQGSIAGVSLPANHSATSGSIVGAFGGTGGGGGGSGTSGVVPSGGGAGVRGGGGGGGGAGFNNAASAAGGTGGDGYCAVTAW